MNSSILPPVYNAPPVYHGTEKYIYFSFSRLDTEAALPIIREFARHGCNVWYCTPFTDPNTRIAKLKTAAAFVCILSPNYTRSNLCANELAFACDSGIPVIPVCVEKADLSEGMQYYLARVHILDISQADSMEDMQARIREVVSYSAEKTGLFIADSTAAPIPGASSRPAVCPSPKKEHDIPAESIAAPKSGAPSPPDFYASPKMKDDMPDAAIPKTSRKRGLLSRLFSGRKAKEKTEKKQTDRISFSVLSPRVVRPDSRGVIDLHMYTDAQREVVDRAIRESGGMVRETSKSGFSVRRETSVTARLESDDAEIKDPLETQVWNGNSLHFDFSFYVPVSYSRSEIAFTCYIEYNGIPVTRLNFVTAVSSLPREDATPAKVVRSDYRKAFISYSRQDEQRMLARVLGIHELAPEMVFWLDKQSMDAGDLWREEIRRAIDISDILLLFWSVPASRSREVESEWRYGLKQHGLPFIAPVPLDPPEQCPPPEDLKSLNFTVRAFSRNHTTERLSFYNSQNIQLI